MDTRYISVEGDFCRRCGGTGGEYEDTDRGTKMWVPCDLCGGGGNQSVRVSETQIPVTGGAA